MAHRMNVVAVLAMLSPALGCRKTEPGSGAGSQSATGSAAGASPAAGTASAAGTGSAAEAGSAVGAGSPAAAGSAVAAGSATGGSGAGEGSATGGSPFEDSPLCRRVIDKIRECHARLEFIQKLDKGATRAQRKINARLRKEIRKWPDADELCGNEFGLFTYEFRGFLDNPAPFSVRGALDSCSAIGAAVRAAGGLVGGDRAH